MPSESLIARALPPEARFDRWTAPDGQPLRRLDWFQPDPLRARGNLLFAGGRSDFIEKYLETYAHWNRAGWNVTAFDWRGQGHSRGPLAPENPDSFDLMVADLDGLVGDWSRERPGRHVAIGHSLGGHLLLRALVDRHPPLDAAVLIAPMVLANAPMPDWLAPNLAEFMCLLGLRDQRMWRTAKALSRPGSQRQALLTGCRQRYEDELWWWEREPGFSLGPPTWGWMRAAYRSAAAHFTPARLAGVDLPLLIVATDRDRLVSPSAIRVVAGLLPRAELEVYADSAHEILREQDEVRDRALARIDAFLDQNAP